MAESLDLIKQVLDRANKKYETTFQVNIKDSQSRIQLSNEIHLQENFSYKIGLILFSVFNMPNFINTRNNQFRYSKDNGATWKTITFPSGAYQYTDLNASIEIQLTDNGDWIENAIVIGVDYPQGKFVLNLATNYQVDFTIANSLRTVLGFDSRIVTATSLGDDIGNIDGGLDTINVVTDLTNGGYITNKNGDLVQRGIIFSIPFLAVNIGDKLIAAPPKPIYYPLNTKTIQSIYFKVVNEDDELIDFGGQNITIIVHIKQV